MRQAELLVFDDVIYYNNGNPSYTIATLNDDLANHDMIAVMAVIGKVSLSPSDFNLFIEHSCDGRNWLRRNDSNQSFPPSGGTGDISILAMNLNTTYARMYSDCAWNKSKVGVSTSSGAGPLLGYVRFAMYLSAGLAQVKLHAVLRDMTVGDHGSGGRGRAAMKRGSGRGARR